jgi:hypothetical protein
VIARTTACASNAKSSDVDDGENAGRFSPVYFLSCSQITQEEKKKRDALIALPSDVANTHRSYDGLPVSVEFVWRENFHEGALRRSSHEHRIREVVAIHAQHDLSNKQTNKQKTTSLVYHAERKRQREIGPTKS